MSDKPKTDGELELESDEQFERRQDALRRKNNDYARKLYERRLRLEEMEDWKTVFTELAGYRDKFASGIEHTKDLVEKAGKGGADIAKKIVGK